MISERMRRVWRELEQAYPAHTCVDQPSLRCPACLKWTGDGFATVKASPQCFADVTRQPTIDTTHHSTSGYAVMIRVRLANAWAWRTWMRYDTYEEAAGHPREGSKVVPFGSAEWAELRSMKAVVPPSARPEEASQQPDAETLVEFVVRFLRRYGFGQNPADDANASRDEHAGFEDLVHQPVDPK
jgi:hypothetical protein